MIENKTIAVVVPTFNEEEQIANVIETIPDFVDRIIIVDDHSTDNTVNIVKNFVTIQSPLKLDTIYNDIKKSKYNKADIVAQEQLKKELNYFSHSQIINQDETTDKIILICHFKNMGVGAAVARGYKWCKDHGIDCTAVMAGDGQMDPAELQSICQPVMEGIDYAKGNRLVHRSSWLVIPKIRFLGNSILSILTKIASGYWHVSDTQSGYTAISKRALNAIDIQKIYKSYGMPNDILVKLNIAFCSIKEVEIKPVYDVGEKSNLKIYKVIPKIAVLLIKSFFKRLWLKYLFRDFHPLFLLYHISFILFITSFPFALKILEHVINQQSVNPVTVLAFIFLFISAFQSLLFAMWMDIQDNERLYKN